VRSNTVITEMSAAAWLTSGVLVTVFAMLIASRRPPDIIMWAGLALLLVAPVPIDGDWHLGVVSVPQALSGLANEGVVTIALLFGVAAGLRDTGAMQLAVNRALGAPRSLESAQRRLVWPTAICSAFLNNTPLVAMLLPVVDSWSKRCGLSASRLLMPLSFASIYGGACTLIGTSTNLVVNGWLVDETGHPGMHMFEIAQAALPIAVCCLLIMLLAVRWLLPDRRPVIGVSEDARRYTVEMLVEPGGPLVGKTVEEAGLRRLPGLYLVEVTRADEVLPAVSPTVRLRGDDRLVLAGVVDSVVDLQKTAGLLPATDQVFKFNQPRTNRILVEAVVSPSCPLLGLTIREGRFRSIYNAAVIAVARSGRHLKKRIGDIELRVGDTLLLETTRSFVHQQKNRRDFYLISELPDSTPPNFRRSPIALGILVSMIAVVAFGILSMLQAAMIAVGLMIVSGCCSATSVRRAIEWEVLLVIAAALGIGKAMQESGLAEVLGDGLQLFFGQDPTIMVAALFGLSMLLSSLITAKAAVVLVLPVALASAANLGVSHMPFVIAVMIAAATSVTTPICYPTNLMVYGPGGYRFTDYIRMGGPLTMVAWVMSIWLIPVFWPF
ncbi:MAG: SLC13 family permease, partial [Arenicellales bacterium]|nr:SLC13 family permease [Arenicellales bacterium]